MDPLVTAILGQLAMDIEGRLTEDGLVPDGDSHEDEIKREEFREGLWNILDGLTATLIKYVNTLRVKPKA